MRSPADCLSWRRCRSIAWRGFRVWQGASRSDCWVTGSGQRALSSAGCLLQGGAAGGYMFTHEQYQFYSVAIVFGFAYEGVMPLYAVLVRENFPVQIIGTVVGAATMASSLGMATGPLLGGVIFDTY